MKGHLILLLFLLGLWGQEQGVSFVIEEDFETSYSLEIEEEGEGSAKKKLTSSWILITPFTSKQFSPRILNQSLKSLKPNSSISKIQIYFYTDSSPPTPLS